MSEEKKLHCCLDLFRRLPPSQIETNLGFSTKLVPDVEDDLLQTVDIPLKTMKDSEASKDFLICDYNRDGDSYRSPYTNQYFPPIEEDEDDEEGGILPPDNLRKMEIKANEVFSVYTKLYYENGLCNVYFWEVDDDSFACAICIKKVGAKTKEIEKAIWDSIHVVEVTPSNGTASYKLTSSIILQLKAKQNNLDLSGTIQRQKKMTAKVNKENTHITNIGMMVQEMENTLRESLPNVYFDKAREVTRTLRSPVNKKHRKMKSKLLNELQGALSNVAR